MNTCFIFEISFYFFYFHAQLSTTTIKHFSDSLLYYSRLSENDRLLTFLNVVPVDGKVVIPIRPVLFVVEPNCVSQFMDDRPQIVTSFSDGYRLNASGSANVRVAPSHIKNKFVTWGWYIYFLFREKYLR